MLLTSSEYSSIRYYHYHKPIDTKPSDYDTCFTNAYKKWCFVFFPNQDGRFVDIDARTLGAMMRLFREKANRNKTELGKILGVDRTTIGFYEEGKRMPSINYLYHFCEYFQISMDEIIHHLAIFVSRLWQIHAFGEGNTRTTAVFFIKYLRTLGFDVTNDIFAENAWYFRNALVRANYNDLKNGIHETTEFLELFLRNLLLNEDHPLHNRSLHIRSLYGISQKANIDNPKANIESTKANIKNAFTVKTASHVCKLLDGFGFQTIFGRSDVQKLLDLKPTRSTELLREMAEKEIIEPVSGYGKGKYRFKQQAV